MWRRLFILTLALITLNLSTATGVQAKGPPAGVPGLGVCNAPTLARPVDECDVEVRARQLTAQEARVGVGQTGVEALEEGPFFQCQPVDCEDSDSGLCPIGCLLFGYRVGVSVTRLGLLYTWLINPAPPGNAILESVATLQ